MVVGRIVLIGAVHESLAAFHAVREHPSAELACVVTLTPELAHRTSGSVDLGGTAAAAGVDVMYVEDVNQPEVVVAIRDLSPDLIVVVGWTRLIGDELLAVPKRGCVGFHASLLPKHRGRAPVNWAILMGESETGNTMMLLDRGVDTGLILDQRSTTIGPDDTCASVYERVAVLGADMLRDNLVAVLDGTAQPREQDHASADVLPKRTPEMGVTDWSRSAQQVHDWIRALTIPYPGAFSHLSGRRVMLWASKRPAVDRPVEPGVAPGTIVETGPEGFWVATGSGTLLVTRAGDPGAPSSPAGEWSNLYGVSAGHRFEQPSPELVAWSLGRGPRPAGGVA